MTEIAPSRDEPESRFKPYFEGGYALFCRLLAICFVAFSILLWAWAVGFWPGEANRFDAMTPPVKAYVAIMAVMFPVTAVGLWTTLAWGRVVWLLTLAAQLTLLYRYPAIHEHREVVVLFHLGCLALYIVFELSLRRIDNEA